MNVIGFSGLHDSVPFKKRMFPNLSPREYRIVQGFDSAAALVTSDGVAAAAAEERFTREKATGSFPVNAIQYCLRASKLKIDAIDYFAHGFDYEPYRSFYRETELAARQFSEVYSRETQLRYLDEHFGGFHLNDKFIQVQHHLAHAASAFYLSGFDESLILVADGMGEQCSTTIALGVDNKINILTQTKTLHSLGLLYGVFTLYLGFAFGLDEYKVMGLAPYGDSRRYFDKLMKLVNLKEDGTYAIPVLFENHTDEEKETYRATMNTLSDMFGPPRSPGGEITKRDMDLAAALQAVLQTCLIHILRHYKKETGQSNLCMAGGVALNCTANGVIKRSRMFKNMFIQPAAGDDGTALGAALFVQRAHDSNLHLEKMALPLWGPSYSNDEIEAALRSEPRCEGRRYDSFPKLVGDVVRLIAAGRIVGWFQGRMEFGPRALGDRSILADPRDPGMRDRVNELIKKREWFRPFAPAVTQEAAASVFEIDDAGDLVYTYMLLVTQLKAAYRSRLPAITHVDGSARVQVVKEEDNPRFWALIREFGEATGVPVLLNTSFNVRGQPIVCTPTEAIETFLSARLDALVIGDHLITAKGVNGGGA